MNVIITTFVNPFSFYCRPYDDNKEINFMKDKPDHSHFSRSVLSDVNHGQYVAVMWNNKWTRGVVTMESQFLIWLIDYGIYLRPNEKTIYVDLPPEYKKYPTKVFEASIHGVVPMDKALTDDCQIKNKIANTWNKGAIEKAQTLIANALETHFVPIAVLCNKNNDIVIGDLYLKISDKKFVNIIDELELWPVFLERNKDVYIENLSAYYTSRRKHRANLLKPDFPGLDLPTITINTTLEQYNAICDSSPEFELTGQKTSSVEDGSTVVAETPTGKKEKSAYKLTSSEIENYSRMYIKVGGREYNVLNVLLNKIRDLKMCEKYKDHDLKSVGRAYVRNRSAFN